MKKLTAPIILLSLLMVSVACAQDLGGISIPQLGDLTKDITVDPYVQAGFQHVGSNLNLPINAQGAIAGLLQIDQMDISLKDANLWAGAVGVNIKAGKLLSLFGSAGGSLNRTFVVSGAMPVSLGPLIRQPILDFDASHLNMWYAQGGIGLGPILLGLYGDHFGIELSDPRRNGVPLNNQTLRADFLTVTFAPYIGFAMPAQNSLFTIIYSPFARSNTTVALRTSAASMAQLEYTWDKPGNLVSCTYQYNMTPMGGMTVGLWGNCAYMDVRGNATLNYVDSTTGASSERPVTATMTKYMVQGGLSLALDF